jgi:hypothetical protein
MLRLARHGQCRVSFTEVCPSYKVCPSYTYQVEQALSCVAHYVQSFSCRHSVVSGLGGMDTRRHSAR